MTFLKKYWIQLISFTIPSLLFFITSVTVVNFVEAIDIVRILVCLLAFFLFISSLIAVYFSYRTTKKNNYEIKNTFESNFQKLVFNYGVGFIFLNTNKEIIWISNFIKVRLSEEIIGQKISAISGEILRQINAEKTKFRIYLDNFHYDVQYDIDSKILSLYDATALVNLENQYSVEKPIIGELEVDNIQQITSVLSNEELFELEKHIIQTLDKFSKEFNIAFRQYTTGKYLIITNRNALNILIERNFPILEEAKLHKLPRGSELTISIGFGYESKSSSAMLKFAQEALSHAKTRGGDQVAIISENNQPEYYGSGIESTRISSSNIVEIKKMTNSIENALRNEEIESVIICGHKYADLDAVGSALGIYELAKHFNKKAYINNVTFDETTKNYIAANFTAEIKNLFISYSKLTKVVTFKKSLLVIVDTADKNRIESPQLVDKINSKNIYLFDNHRPYKLPQGIQLENLHIDTASSSASEIVTEMIQFLSIILRPHILSIQMLLNGIYLDTQQFLIGTSARTFKAASWLQEQGAKAIVAAETLKLSSAEKKKVNLINQNVTEVKTGYFIAWSDLEVSDEIVSMAANELLKIKNHKATFVIAKIANKNHYKLSARSINVNVQKIVENVGGGGHFSSAAAISNELREVFVENVRQAIISETKEG